MNGKIDIYITQRNKEKMQSFKDLTNANFTKQINNIFTSYMLYSIDVIDEIIYNNYPIYYNDSVVTVSIQKGQISSLHNLTEWFYLLKLKYPKLTFQDMLFILVDHYFYQNNF